MSQFKEQLAAEKERAQGEQESRTPAWLRLILHHWKQMNEAYMLIIVAILWYFFPVMNKFIYDLIYPGNEYESGFTDPGFLQNILLGLLCFYAGLMASWWAIKFSFPVAGKWLDDIFESRAFKQRTFGATDRVRAKILITMYLTLAVLACWCIVMVMP